MKRILLSIILTFSLCATAFSASEWDKSKFADDTLIPDAPALMRVNNEAQDRLLSTYSTINIAYTSATTVTASAGSVTCSNSDGSVRKMRLNPSTTAITFSDIDTGAEASSTTYYVYANCDADATTATFKVSTSSSAPSGITYYKKIGSFYNNSSSNIDQSKIYTNAYGNTVNDSSGIPEIVSVFDYSTSSSSYTVKESAMKIAFGNTALSGGSLTVTNLPFTSSSSYTVIISLDTGAGTQSQGATVAIGSASSFTVTESQGTSKTIHWVAIGY